MAMSDTQDIAQGGINVLKWGDLTPEEQDRCWVKLEDQWVKLAWAFSAPPDASDGADPWERPS